MSFYVSNVGIQVSGESEDEAAGIDQFRLENIKDRPPILDRDALHDAYEDIAWEEPLDWTQTQVCRCRAGQQPTDKFHAQQRCLEASHQLLAWSTCFQKKALVQSANFPGETAWVFVFSETGQQLGGIEGRRGLEAHFTLRVASNCLSRLIKTLR
jgi:hypothetical protein